LLLLRRLIFDKTLSSYRCTERERECGWGGKGGGGGEGRGRGGGRERERERERERDYVIFDKYDMMYIDR